MNYRTQRKISIKTVVGSIKKVVADEGYELFDETLNNRRMKLMRLIGIASDFQCGETDYGSWVALLGQFKASNLIDGSISVSSKCFLPAGLGETISEMIKTNDGVAVEIAFDIQLEFDSTSPVGYRYECESLTDLLAVPDSALSRLEKSLNLPALEGHSPPPVPELKRGVKRVG